MIRTLIKIFVLASLLSGCATDATMLVFTSEFSSCTPTTPVAKLGLDPFYQKYCDANGIPIVSSDNVRDSALEWVRYQVLEMLKLRPDVAGEMVNNGTRVAIIADNELTTDIPEYRDLYEVYPDVDWNTRTRGLGGVPGRPVGSTSEENVLCDRGDRYEGEDILVHEFAHTIENIGLKLFDPEWGSKIAKAFDAAIASGLWQDCEETCFITTNSDEYFAEGAQSFFGVNWDNTQSPVHNHVDTRDELASYDPGLYQLLVEVFSEQDLPLCPTIP